jgi:hypothetical protein
MKSRSEKSTATRKIRLHSGKDVALCEITMPIFEAHIVYYDINSPEGLECLVDDFAI